MPPIEQSRNQKPQALLPSPRKVLSLSAPLMAPLLLGLAIATLSHSTEAYVYSGMEYEQASLITSINANSQLAYFSGGGTGGNSNMGNTTGKTGGMTSAKDTDKEGSGAGSTRGGDNSPGARSPGTGGSGDADKTGSGPGSTRGGDKSPGARSPNGSGNTPNGVQGNGNNTNDPDKQGSGPGSTRGGDKSPADAARREAVSKAQEQAKTAEKQTTLGNFARTLNERFGFTNPNTPTTPTRSLTPSQTLTDKLTQPYNMGNTAVQAVADKVAMDARIAAAERTEALANSLTKSVTPTTQKEYFGAFAANPRNVTPLTTPATAQPDLNMVDLAALTKLRGANINDIVTPAVARSILNNNTPALQRDEMQAAYDKLSPEQTKVAAVLSNQAAIQGISQDVALGMGAIESHLGVAKDTYKQDSYVGVGQIGKAEFAANASAAAKALGINDPYGNIQASVSYMKNITTSLQKKGIANPTAGQVYGAYNQGVTGYSKLNANPEKTAASVVGLSKVKANLPSSMKARAATMTAAEFAKTVEGYPSASFSKITGANLSNLQSTPSTPSKQTTITANPKSQVESRISGTVTMQQPARQQTSLDNPKSQNLPSPSQIKNQQSTTPAQKQQTSLDNPESQNLPSPAQVKSYLTERGWPANKPINGQYGYRLSNLVSRAETELGVKAPKDYFSSTYRTPEEQAQIKATSLGKNFTFEGVTYKPDWSHSLVGTKFQAAAPNRSAHQVGMAADTINVSKYGPEASAAAMKINSYVQKTVSRVGEPDVNKTGLARLNPRTDPNHIEISSYSSKKNTGGTGQSAMLDSSIGAKPGASPDGNIQTASVPSKQPSTVQSIADKLKSIAGITPSTPTTPATPAAPIKKEQSWSDWAQEKVVAAKTAVRNAAIAQYKRDHPILGGILDSIGYFDERKTPTKPTKSDGDNSGSKSPFPRYNNTTSTRSY